MVRVTGSRPERRSPARDRRPELAWLALWLVCAVILLVIPGWPAILAALGVIAAAMTACILTHGQRRRGPARVLARRVVVRRGEEGH